MNFSISQICNKHWLLISHKETNFSLWPLYSVPVLQEDKELSQQDRPSEISFFHGDKASGVPVGTPEVLRSRFLVYKQQRHHLAEDCLSVGKLSVCFLIQRP